MAGIYLNPANNKIPTIYLHNYHPWGIHKLMGGNSSNYDRTSGLILDFKEGKKHAITHFTTEIENMLDTNFGICVVPSHDPAKATGPLHVMTAQLATIVGRNDMSNQLVRHTKINKLAGGGTRNKQVHLDSIKVAKPKLVTGKKILLLDDVSTTGNSIDACRELLMNAGATYVWGLVIGKTI
jgi:hypothetical protein